MKTYIIFCVRSAGSWLSLEVIAGPAIGLQHAVHSTSTSKLPVNLGRVSPADLVLKDSEVSGRHAQITWNSTVRSYIVYLFDFSMSLLTLCVTPAAALISEIEMGAGRYG